MFLRFGKNTYSHTDIHIDIHTTPHTNVYKTNRQINIKLYIQIFIQTYCQYFFKYPIHKHTTTKKAKIIIMYKINKGKLQLNTKYKHRKIQHKNNTL